MANLNMKIQLLQIFKRYDPEVVVKTEEDTRLHRAYKTKFVIFYANQPSVRFVSRK